MEILFVWRNISMTTNLLNQTNGVYSFGEIDYGGVPMD